MGGQDKGLLKYQGRLLIEHVIERFAPQVDALCINANRNLERYRQLGYPVISDPLPDYPGPLAGLLAGLREAVGEYVAFVPCDAPDLPSDLVARLLAALRESSARAAIAHDGQRAQPLHALVKCDCRDDLAGYLAAGERKAARWMRQIGVLEVDFHDAAAHFHNLNDPAGLAGD